MKDPINKDQTIGDVIKKYPDTADIMLGYGLQCVGCSVNPYETIEQGALGHGMTEDTIKELLEDMNMTVTKKPKYPLNPDGITLSPRALETLEAILESDNKKDHGLTVKAEDKDGELDYYLDIVEKPEEDQKTLEWQGFKIFINDESFKLMNPSLIDFLHLPGGEEGFKIISMNTEDTGMECNSCQKPKESCECKPEGGKCCGGSGEGCKCSGGTGGC